MPSNTSLVPEDPMSPGENNERELTDEDILDAMQQIPCYLDISTEDFRVIYHLTWRHAAQRLRERNR